jgi:hypothetical protein
MNNFTFTALAVPELTEYGQSETIADHFPRAHELSQYAEKVPGISVRFEHSGAEKLPLGRVTRSWHEPGKGLMVECSLDPRISLSSSSVISQIKSGELDGVSLSTYNINNKKKPLELSVVKQPYFENARIIPAEGFQRLKNNQPKIYFPDNKGQTETKSTKNSTSVQFQMEPAQTQTQTQTQAQPQATQPSSVPQNTNPAPETRQQGAPAESKDFFGFLTHDQKQQFKEILESKRLPVLLELDSMRTKEEAAKVEALVEQLKSVIPTVMKDMSDNGQNVGDTKEVLEMLTQRIRNGDKAMQTVAGCLVSASLGAGKAFDQSRSQAPVRAPPSYMKRPSEPAPPSGKSDTFFEEFTKQLKNEFW